MTPARGRLHARPMPATAFDTASAVRDALATKADLANLEARLIWRMVLALAAQGAFVIAAVKLIP